jgi:hypothetical protein
VRHRRPDLVERDLGLGPEDEVLRHFGLAPPLGVVRPGFRQEQRGGLKNPDRALSGLPA